LKKDTLKYTLSKQLKEQPSSSFSKNVMQQIQEEAFLKSHLKTALIQKAPLDLKARVLSECLPNSVVTNYKPVISKKAWFIIMSVIVVILILSLNKSDSASIIQSNYITKPIAVFNTYLSVFTNYLISHSFIILMFFGVTSLITIESLLKIKKFDFKKAY